MKEIGQIIWFIGLIFWLLVFIIPLIYVRFNFREWLFKVNVKLMFLSIAVIWIGIIIMLIGRL